MRFNWFLVLMSLLVSVMLSAQEPYFAIQVDFPDKSDQATAVLELDDGRLLVAGQSLCFEILKACFPYFIVNSTGEVVLEQNISDESCSYTFADYDGSLTKIGDSFYSTLVTNCAESIDFNLIKLDSEFSVVLNANYGTLGEERPRAHVLSPDGNLLVIGFTRTDENDPANSYLIKLDLEGQLLWEKEIEFDGNDIGHSIVSNADGTIAVGGRRQKPQVENLLWEGYFLLLDSLGNTLHSEFYETFRNHLAFELRPSINEGYIAFSEKSFPFGQGTSSNPNVHFVARLDSLGAILWEHQFVGEEYILIRSIFETSNGDILVCGTDRNLPEDILDHITDIVNGISSFSFIAKLDKDGNLLWYRNYVHRHDRLGNNLLDIIETESGDIVAVGDATEPTGLNGLDHWILKLDPYGCLIPGCTEDVLYLETNEFYPSTEDTTTYSGTGQIYSKQVYFDLSPNPATTETLLKFYNEVSGEHSRLVVSDISGRELLKMSLANGSKTHYLNIEDLPVGTLLLSYYQNGRLVQSEKLLRL